jgi:hypothetical protein
MVGRDVPKVLIANKCDLLNRREISVEEGKAFAKKINCPFLECSAKSNSNINKVFHTMLVEINKFESNIDLKGFACKKLNEFFVKKETILLKIFYVLILVNIVFINNVAFRYNRYDIWILSWNKSFYFEYSKF